jgi:DNA replication protein DnaC
MNNSKFRKLSQSLPAHKKPPDGQKNVRTVFNDGSFAKSVAKRNWGNLPSEGLCENNCGFWDITHPRIVALLTERNDPFLAGLMECRCDGKAKFENTYSTATGGTIWEHQEYADPKVFLGGVDYKHVRRLEPTTDKQKKEKIRLEANIPLSNSFTNQTFGTFYYSDERPTPHDLKRKQARENVLAFANGDIDAKTVLIHGPVGTGKSHLAIAVLHQILDRGLTGRYENARELISEKLVAGYMNASYGKNEEYFTETRGSIIQRCKQVDCLILDDIGTEKSSTYTNNTLYDIIDTRIRDEKLLVLTTNVSARDSERQFGKRVHSRLMASSVLRVDLNVDDYRRRGRNNAKSL